MRLQINKINAYLAICSIFAFTLVAQGQSSHRTQQNTSPPPPVALPPSIPKSVGDSMVLAGWKRYQFNFGDGDVLSLLLPGAQPEESTERVENFPGIVITQHLFTSSLKSSFYGASYIEISLPSGKRIPESFKNSFAEIFNKAFVNGFKQTLEKMGLNAVVTPLAQRKTTISGYEASEQDIAIGNMVFRAQMVFVDQHAYVAMALWNKDAPEAEHTEFFKSVKISKH